MRLLSSAAVGSLALLVASMNHYAHAVGLTP